MFTNNSFVGPEPIAVQARTLHFTDSPGLYPHSSKTCSVVVVHRGYSSPLVAHRYYITNIQYSSLIISCILMNYKQV